MNGAKAADLFGTERTSFYRLQPVLWQRIPTWEQLYDQIDFNQP